MGNEVESTDISWKKVGDFVVLSFLLKVKQLGKPDLKYAPYQTFVVIDRRGLPTFASDADNKRFGDAVDEFIAGDWEFEDELERKDYEDTIKIFLKAERCYFCGKWFAPELMDEVEITIDGLGKESMPDKAFVCFQCKDADRSQN